MCSVMIMISVEHFLQFKEDDVEDDDFFDESLNFFKLHNILLIVGTITFVLGIQTASNEDLDLLGPDKLKQVNDGDLDTSMDMQEMVVYYNPFATWKMYTFFTLFFRLTVIAETAVYFLQLVFFPNIPLVRNSHFDITAVHVVMLAVVIADSLVGCLTVTNVHFASVLCAQSLYLIYEFCNPDIYDTFGLDYDWLPEFTLTIMIFSVIFNTIYIKLNNSVLEALGDPFNQILFIIEQEIIEEAHNDMVD